MYEGLKVVLLKATLIKGVFLQCKTCLLPKTKETTNIDQ